MEILTKLVGLFGGGAGATVGGLVANVSAFLMLAPLGLWLVSNKDGIFISLSYGDLAFWGVVGFGILKIAHWTRAPGS